MARPFDNRFQQPRTLMNMGGSREAEMRAFLERKRLKERAAAILAANEALALGAGTNVEKLDFLPAKSSTVQDASPQRPTSRFNVTQGGSGESAALTQLLQGIGERNIPIAQKNLAQGGELVDKGLNVGRTVGRSLLSMMPTPNVDEFSEPNIPFFQNPRFSPQPGRSGKPSQMYGVPQRARGLGTGSESYKPAGPRGGQLTGPMAPNPLMPARQTAMPEDEDEFMSWDNKMFLLSLLAGMQGGKPPTPYGTAAGGGNKPWAPLPFPRMA